MGKAIKIITRHIQIIQGLTLSLNLTFHNQQGRSQTFTICRGHDTLYRKLERLHQKTARTNK